MLEKLKNVMSWSVVSLAPVLTRCAIMITAVVAFAVVWAEIIFLVQEMLKWFGLF